MGLTDMLVQHIPSSKRATAAKVARDYTGPQDPSIPLVKFMTDAAPRGPLVMHIAKLFPKQVSRGEGAKREKGPPGIGLDWGRSLRDERKKLATCTLFMVMDGLLSLGAAFGTEDDMGCSQIHSPLNAPTTKEPIQCPLGLSSKIAESWSYHCCLPTVKLACSSGPSVLISHMPVACCLLFSLINPFLKGPARTHSAST